MANTRAAPSPRHQDQRYLPPSWDDDARMNAMFSDFRSRGVNPTDWDAKMSFWKQLINDWSQECSRATFTVAAVRHAFSRNGRTPRGLPTVTAEMENNGDLVTLSSFLKSTSEPGWVSWSLDLLVKRPLSYSWSLISRSLWPQPANGNLEYVNMNVLRAKADAVLQRHHNLAEKGEEDSTVSFEVLSKHCRDICKNEKDLDLCLLLLRKDKQLTLHSEQQQKVVKFLSGGSEPQKSSQLSESEKAIVRLRTVKKTLEHQIQLHESEAEKFKMEAKNHLKSGSRSLAKAALQKKKQSEAQLLKKENSLENIEVLLQQLQDVDTQKAVLDALQAGSNAFKFGQKESGFDLDKVDETMAAIQETLEMQEELQEILGKPVHSLFETSELEKELEEIMTADDSREADVNYSKLSNFTKTTDEVLEYPEPPTHLPEDASVTTEKDQLPAIF